MTRRQFVFRPGARAGLVGLALLLGGCDLVRAGIQDLVDGRPAAGPGRAEQRDDARTSLFRRLDRNAAWRLVSQTKMSFTTHHTQGLVKLGDTFYVSSVEVLADRVRSGSTDALTDFSIDRTPGAGRGWLFKFDAAGTLLGKVELTAGDVYHPGGIDHDGRHLWVPVAEYRPNSASHVYRVDPSTLAAERWFSVRDHIGGVVRDPAAGTFHGVSWGSRRLYTFAPVRQRDGGVRVESRGWVPNPSFHVDYQDCHYAGVAYMLCGGLVKYPTPVATVAFGAIEMVDLRRHRPEHQLPANVYVDDGAGVSAEVVVTGNAFWAEPRGSGAQAVMRFYFMTESDNQADLVIYDVTPWRKPVP